MVKPAETELVLSDYLELFEKDAILMLNSISMTAMVPGRQVADFGAIGMIERFEDELSPVTASGSDGISDGRVRR